jgi:uncharacterized protein (DUF2336 family)
MNAIDSALQAVQVALARDPADKKLLDEHARLIASRSTDAEQLAKAIADIEQKMAVTTLLPAEAAALLAEYNRLSAIRPATEKPVAVSCRGGR